MVTIALSVVVPVYNERENIAPLCERISTALDGVVVFEIVLVDDGSSDGTSDALRQVAARYPTVRAVCHARNAGQSAAICSGVGAARGALIATLDGDLQNDPSDIPKLLEIYHAQATDGPIFIAGNRVDRQDNWLRKVSSRIANRVRSALLHDHCPDTGCSLKLFRRADFLLLPQFDHLHRFLPALFARAGVAIVNVPVIHHRRAAGVSKYGVGNRLWVGIVDLLGVRWLLRRSFSLNPGERHGIKERAPNE